MLLMFNGAILLARALAATGNTGDVAIFDYAARLVLAGQQVLLAGALAVALTKWSQRATPEGTNPQIGRTIAVALGLVIPAATALALLAPELIDVLLTGGRFGSGDAASVAEVLRWMAPGIAAQMVLLLGFRALTAYQVLWPMAGIGVAHVVALVVIARVAQPALGVNGVGLAYSISWIIGVALTLVALRPLIEPGSHIRRQALATAVAALVAGAATSLILVLAPEGLIVRLVLGFATFAVVGWVVGYVAGVDFVRSATRQALVLRPASA
jgi:putative peptidoglycan lipid II flippase